MGLFRSKLFVWNPAAPSSGEELLVDTEASYSWLARSRIEALGIQATGKMKFQTIDGGVLEREVAPIFVRADGRVGGDTVVLAEAGDAEVFGAHTLECLGLAADPVQKKLVPTVGMALSSRAPALARRSRVVQSIDGATSVGRLTQPFSNEDFKTACPGFGKGTYNAFLWKHRCGNAKGETEYFELVGKNRFRRIRNGD